MDEALQLMRTASQMGGERLALMKDGRLVEYYEEQTSLSSLVGTVLLGTVERVLPDIKAAFVKIGLHQNGFLPIKEQESFHQTQGNAPLMSGQAIIVQIKKDEKGSKGAFLTRDVALPGQYALLMPMNGFIGVSKRITGEGERERAKRLGAKLADGRFGLIMRHAALFAMEQEVTDEVEALNTRWLTLKAQADFLKAPAVLDRPAPMVATLLKDYAARHICELYTDAEPPDDIPSAVQVNVLPRAELEALWRSRQVDAQLDEALRRYVPIAGGGSLIIDQREALQTIDVNSGSAVMAEEGCSLALMSNLSAVPEIARQIRLRGLSGIILVDFIDMDTDGEREAVRTAMVEAVADDGVKTVVHDFTELGLLEITRKRTRDSLSDVLTQGCAACRETGRIRRK